MTPVRQGASGAAPGDEVPAPLAPERALRADAQRNLDRLLEAASEAFAELGTDVSVDEIARRAGVGHGTVFRRFPTKEALLVAVVLERVRALTTAAEAAFEEPDAASAFAGFLRQAAETYARDRALVEGLDKCVARPEVDALVEAVDRLVRRAKEADALRLDVTAEDVLLLVPTASRYLDIVLDGLRPPNTELSST